MKIALPLFFVLLGFQAFAYVPMLQESHYWRSLEGGWLPSLVTYQVEGSSVMAGQEYARIQNYYGEVGENMGSGYFMREDAESEQVWLRWNEDTSEILYYDFSLEVGDSVTFSDCNIQATCISVELVMMADGISRKHITVEEMGGWYQELWIEGIGSLNGPIAPGAFFCIADWDPFLQCFYNNQELVFTAPNVQEPCSETNVGEHDQSNWEFLAQGNLLQLKGNTRVNYQLIDLRGRTLMHGELYPGKVLNLQNFARGSYVFTAWNNSTRKSKRILLQE